MAKKSNLYPTEDDEQMVLAEYLDHRFGYYGWIHVPNQRWAKVQYIRKLSKMGVKKGFPDILIFESVLSYPVEESNMVEFSNGVALELKRQRGAKPTIKEEQRDWAEHLKLCGWITVIAYGAQDAINKIKEVYGEGV